MKAAKNSCFQGFFYNKQKQIHEQNAVKRGYKWDYF